MTAHLELDKASNIAVQARQSGLLPGVDALILGAATGLAEHGAQLGDLHRLLCGGAIPPQLNAAHS